MRAKYYIYRNLNKGGFSIKYKGIVVDRGEKIIAHGVEFKVSEKGRQRCISEGRRNVHAYAACESYKMNPWVFIRSSCLPVQYNPYKMKQFEWNCSPIYKARIALFEDGKCFVPVNM